MESIQNGRTQKLNIMIVLKMPLTSKCFSLLKACVRFRMSHRLSMVECSPDLLTAQNRFPDDAKKIFGKLNAKNF